jgi:hypothetical protein
MEDVIYDSERRGYSKGSLKNKSPTTQVLLPFHLIDLSIINSLIIHIRPLTNPSHTVNFTFKSFRVRLAEIRRVTYPGFRYWLGGN